MLNIIARKFIYACLSLFVVASLTFFLMKAIPGDPFQQEQALPTAIYKALRTHYGLNDPIHIQYIKYLKQLITFDFGPSLVYIETNVSQLIFESFPTSLLLGAEALAIAIPLGILLGTIAALNKNHWQDTLIITAAVIGISIPSFILATLLQYVFSIKLSLLPIARWDTFSHTLLPAISLAVLPIAFLARMTRTKMIEESQQPYITTARSKGFPEALIIYRHLLRNILTPILSYLGPLTANILTGSFIVEKIYSVPGLGYWFVTSVLNRDYPLIMGITLFYCAILLFANFIVDIVCLLIDPRLADSARKQILANK